MGSFNYIVDESGTRTHVIVPVRVFEQLAQEHPPSESVFVDIEEAERWLTAGLSETLDLSEDSIYSIQGRKSNAPADLSEHLDDYLYGKRR